MSNSRIGIGFIGLGSIGLRMLRAAHIHARLRPTLVWDPDESKRARAVDACPGTEAAADATAVITARNVDVLYVASPPSTHADHAHAGLDAGKPVLCEKPLGVDEDVSRALVEHAARARVPNAVNFIHASGAGQRLVEALAGGRLGNVHCAELRLHLRHWRERRHAEAPWLRSTDQGGMVREVMSHFVFLSRRLFGPGRVEYCHLRRPGGAGSTETQALARLDFGGVPVSIMASTEGAGPDVSEYTVWGELGSRRVSSLYTLEASDGGAWCEVGGDSEAPPARWQRAQLDNVAEWASGRTHTLADFAEGLEVQRIIEAMLRAGAGAR